MWTSTQAESRRLHWSAALALALHLGVAGLMMVDWVRQQLADPHEPLPVPPVPLDVSLQPDQSVPENVDAEQWLNPDAARLPPSKLEMKWTLGEMPVELEPPKQDRPVPPPIQLSMSDEIGAALRSGRPIRLPRQRATPSVIYEIALVDLSARRPAPENLGEAPDLAESEAAVTAPASAAGSTAIAEAQRGTKPERESPAPEKPEPKAETKDQAESAPAEADPPVESELPAEAQVAEAGPTDVEPTEVPVPEPDPEARPAPELDTNPETEPEVAEPELLPETQTAAAEPLNAAAEQQAPRDEPPAPSNAPEGAPQESETGEQRPEQVAINTAPPPEAEPDPEAAPDRGPGEWTANSSEFFSKLTAHIYEVNRAVLQVESPSPRRLTLDVRFVMRRDGRVMEAEVMRSSGNAALDEAARAVLIAASPLPMMAEDMPQERLQLIAPIEVYRP